MGPAKRSGHPKSLAVLVLAGVVLGSLALPAHGQSADAHVLRFGADLTAQSGISLDPTVSKGSNDFPWQNLIYDTLIHIAKDGSAQPGSSCLPCLGPAMSVQLGPGGLEGGGPSGHEP